MGCLKTLTIDGACELETCSTQDKISVSPDYVASNPIAYAPDLCYAVLVSVDLSIPQTHIYKYVPATNTVSLRASIAGIAVPSTRLVYDAVHQKFVWGVGAGAPNTVYMFDPQTDTVTSFAAGISLLANFVYVPQKGRIYGGMGRNGLGLQYIGYLDLDLQIVVQLGILPAVGASVPIPRNLVYVPSTDSLYGCWETGLGSDMAKFDLATNTGDSTVTPAGIGGNEICLDTDRNLLIVHYSSAKEVNPTTGAIVGNYAIPVDRASIEYQPYYCSSLKKVFGLASDLVTGEFCVESWNTQTQVTDIVFGGDVNHAYYALKELKDGSCLTNDYFDPTSDDGLRRLCLT